MKLNLCSGPFPRKGYVNLDILPYLGTNIVSDARALPFKDASFDEVHFIHAIEHFIYDEAMDILNDLKRILKKKGTLIVEGPDIVKSVIGVSDPRRSIQYLFGALDEIRHNPLYTHKWGHTGMTLAEDMHRLGYKIKSVGEGGSHGRRERDYRVEGQN